ncbi:ABC transporter permease [Chitinophaga sp. Cy-1792]|uniref:ABC transporter permease n=1 Tax=Chitinophaga sp. Cy-1792 TaxID=2608339 RepID=UPI0014246DBD|nr:ABC transporter permease [Chitinophaga sp. Cy-1792]NIG52969.1 ABC transporter permease [Chitinophaga sp. Cy-1792]
MNKISLIIRHEFMTRVKKKSFLVVTLLVPLAIAAMMIIPALIAGKSASDKRIAVIDNSGYFTGQFNDSKNTYYKFLAGTNLDSLKQNYEKMGYAGILFIPQIDINRPSGFEYYSNAQANLAVESSITGNLNAAIEKKRMELNGIDKNKLDEIRANVTVDFRNTKNEKSSSSAVSFVIGYASGLIIYVMLLIFGTTVMRGVMEEKVNRIAEVMISSVRPFQLMMGKIIGIAAVGLVQFFIWGILIFFMTLLLPAFISPESAQMAGGQASNPEMQEAMKKMTYVMGSVNWTLLIGCFIFYFFGGYLFYSSLFAAVGSVVNEDPQDAQQLSLPVTMPIIISIVIMMRAVSDPTSPVAVWASIIPFSSPMIMMARLPAGVPGTVPIWQLVLSMALLIAGFLFTTWMSGRIYRTGILMYGKKVTLKEASKWIFSKV